MKFFVKVEVDADTEEIAARLLEEAANNVRAGARTLKSSSAKEGKAYVSTLMVVKR